MTSQVSLYFDHAATTPMREVARDTWMRYATQLNPGGQYRAGRQARSILDDARESIAECLGADPIEVIFTSSGTEADNIAVAGLFQASPSQRVVSSPIEHPAVLETVRALDAEVEYFPVDASGVVSDVSPASAPAAVVTCMWANNETGAIQPVEKIIAAANDNPVHIDAVQVVGHLPVNFHALGATTLAASAHKFGGPRGSGILLARRNPAPAPIIRGGGQERGIRSGTVDVASAAATAAALREAVAQVKEEARRLRNLRDYLISAVTSQIPEVLVHTQEPALPGHAHFSFPGAEGDSLIMLLDAAGIAAATGSACSNGVNRASHVLLAMGVSEHDARCALRFTLGRTTTQEDVEELVRVLPGVVAKARQAGMAI